LIKSKKPGTKRKIKEYKRWMFWKTIYYW